MLLTEQNTKSVERKVRSAAAQRFGRGKARPVFEHGHWWVIVPDYLDPGFDGMFDVIDAEPGIRETGLDFEDRQKQADDFYGKTALDMIQRWDDGQSVWTVEMGGLGPAYEQAIQILMMELIREQWGYPLPDDKTWGSWGDNTISHYNQKLGGLSSAQVGAAKQLAHRFLRDGPQKVFQSLKNERLENRMIQVQKSFPSL